MGVLRLLLASIVLASHVGAAPAYSGVMAVECFFVISGFYMQMIIREQYAHHPHWRRKFLISRFLRIFIPYWVTLSAIVAISAFIHEDLPTGSLFSNVFIIGTEHIKLWRAVEGCMSFDWQQLLIPQVWSVGIELMFYAIAPVLLVCRTGVLVAITALSMAGKAWLLAHDYHAAFLECGDGLLNGIFPLEIGIFTMGALCYRFYAAVVAADNHFKAENMYQVMLALVIAASAGFTIGLHYWPSPLEVVVISYIYIAAVTLALPFLFHASRTIVRDRFVGDLSYSFYLCHLYVAHHVLTEVRMSKYVKFILLELATVACAYAINRFVEKPLDALRHRYFR